MLGFVTGPFTGTPAICSGRFTVVGKSPLTGGWGDANSGGVFGPCPKFAGYDAVFFRGIAQRPVYLSVDDGKAELHDAAALWGKDCLETEDALKAIHGDDAEVACIGAAARAPRSSPASSRTRGAPPAVPASARSWAPSGSRPSS